MRLCRHDGRVQHDRLRELERALTEAEQQRVGLVASLQACVTLLDGETEPLPPVAWQVELAEAKRVLRVLAGETA